MRDADGRLLRTYNGGEARLNAYLEDHAYLLEALTRRLRGDVRAALVRGGARDRDDDDRALRRPENGGFFTTSDDHEELIARRKDLDDHPAPSGNSAAANGLLRLAALTGDAGMGAAARGVLLLLAEPARKHPQGLAYLLTALDLYIAPTREVALIAPAGEPGRPRSAGGRRPWPATGPTWRSPAGCEGDAVPALLADRPAVRERRAAYVCESFSCKAPVGRSPSSRRCSRPRNRRLDAGAQRLRGGRFGVVRSVAIMPSSAWSAIEHQSR